ncbi:DUF7718 family protein [Pseudoclavibacter albus]|uniref:DUF7718 family protein n=1 Tax=Pseudoclavibacter albus TaxID=272241 RepID=UPI004057B92E
MGRGKYAKESHRRAKRSARHQRNSDQGNYTAPFRGDLTPTSYQTYICDDTFRLSVRFWKLQQHVADYSISLEQFTDEAWVELAEADLRHGEAHVHVRYTQPEKRVHILKLDTLDDVKHGMQASIAHLQQLAATLNNMKEQA